MLATTRAKAAKFGRPKRLKVSKVRSTLNATDFVKRNEAWLNVSGGIMRYLETLGVAEEGPVEVEIVELLESATDSQIEATLPEKHSLQFATLVSMLEEQFDGRQGHVPRSGALAYVGGMPTQVILNRDKRTRWHVADWSKDGEPWPAGTKIIYEV